VTDTETPERATSGSPQTEVSARLRQYTFLFTDIVSSTGFWDRAPDQMDEAMARHDRILGTAVSAHGGVLVKHTGDGMLAVFDNPIEGVLAAVDAQVAFSGEQWNPDAVIESRMGLHSGPAIVRSGDYFGTSPIRCVRIMGLAVGGQILMSEEVALAIDDVDVSHGLHKRYLGEHQLRGLSRAERVYQVHTTGLRSEFPPPAGAVSLVPLPRKTTRLIGRDHDVAGVRRLLGAHPIVTLVGAGGVGKSSLAIQVATLEHAERRRVVAYADLAPAFSSVVTHTIAAAVGASKVNDETPLDALARTLSELDAVLVLDNGEHVIGAVAELIGTLVSRCGSLKVLVTSQVPIGLPGERVVRLDPLDTEPGGAATQLFVERAREADLSFEPALHDSDIADLCAALDGLPLAIELAAARVRSFDPSQILDRLDRRLRFLRVPEGHPQARRGDTLGAAIAWSFELLDKDERLVFGRLGAFRGPFTLASAEVVVGFDPIETWAVADHLDRLVRRSLVTVQGRGPFRRYRLLESIAAFAAERLAEEDDDRSVRERHARHYLSELTELHPDHADRVDALDLESANVRAAVAWSAAADPTATARLLLDRYRMLRDVGWQDDAHAWFTIVARHDPFDDPGERAILLQRLGQLSVATGRDLDRGRAALEEALRAAEDVGNHRRALDVRLLLATALSLYPASLDLDAASMHLGVLEAALEHLDDPGVETRVHNCAAFVHLYRLESTKGVRRARLARQAAERAHSRALTANARGLEGAHLAYAGEIDRGLREMETAWDEATATGDVSAAASVAWLRGYASVLLADPHDAIRWFERELNGGHVEGNPVVRRSLRANLGIALVLMGRLDEADEIAEDSLSINGTLLEPLLGFARGSFDEVRRILTMLLDRLRRAGDHNEYAAVSYWAGRFSNILGHRDLASTHLAEALEIATRPPCCPYYEVPVRAELALAGDDSQLPRLRELADTGPIRGLEARIHLAEGVRGATDAAEPRFLRALEVANKYALVIDRVEILIRRSIHRASLGDIAGRDVDVDEARTLSRRIGLAQHWEFAVEPRR
jgi:predicted ATPase/class 3 adenylate cyclase/tetratricopeptide (TPR) repeat protein